MITIRRNSDLVTLINAFSCEPKFQDIRGRDRRRNTAQNVFGSLRGTWALTKEACDQKIIQAL